MYQPACDLRRVVLAEGSAPEALQGGLAPGAGGLLVVAGSAVGAEAVSAAAETAESRDTGDPYYITSQ